jgi:preprotein translocase subunit SecG
MKTFLLIVEFLSGLLLIGAILLHAPKGDGLGGIGGQAHLFNYTKGLESGLNKATGILAGIFLFTAALLGIIFI